jgi:hypothetical protein
MCAALLGIGLLGACGDDTVPCPADDHKLRVMVDAICPAAFAEGKPDDALLAGVAADEMVRLIVDLPVKMGADSATITRTGDLLLDAMSTFEVADVKRLCIVPQLALRTKKAGIDHMRTCKLVCALHTDALLEPRSK